jgi:hypothetical protein
VDFELPQELVHYLGELDDFIEREIKPLQALDDNELLDVEVLGRRARRRRPS